MYDGYGISFIVSASCSFCHKRIVKGGGADYRLKKKKSLMMKEKRRIKCFNRNKCVKHKMDLEKNNGNLGSMKVLED